MPRAVSIVRLLTASLALGTVGLLGLAALAASGAMTWGTALLAAAALLAGLVWRVWRPMKDAAAIADMADRVTETEIPPAVRTPELVEIGASLARARTGLLVRADELTRRVAAAEGILEALPDPVLLLDRDRRVVRANPAARELLGVDPSGNDLAGFLRTPAVLAAANAVLADGKVREVAYRVDVPSERHFGVRIAPVAKIGDDDRGTRAVVRLVDLTAVKRAEEMRADFAANASHELKTPLSALIGFIETLRGPARDDPEAQERFLGLMAVQAERMSRLVNDLLALATIELVEHAPPTTPVALGAIARAAAQALEMRAAERGMKIAIVIDEELPPVPGDAEQLAQLIQNLLDNALKYGAPNTEVTLRLALIAAPPGMGGAGKVVALSVTDRGDGIAEEHLPRLTERFYRVDSARSREAGGTGLGLAIVKHILGRHRGQLRIESTVGVGSTFTAYLPAGRAEA